MSIYLFKNNCIAYFKDKQTKIRSRLVFKTRETHWLNTEHPVVIPVSIHSALHKYIDGDLKMNAFMSSIKIFVKGKITVLLTERAHLQTYSLKHRNDIEKAFDECLSMAETLKKRYQPYFESCEVVYWHSYIRQDKNFLNSVKTVQDLFQYDPIFRNHLLNDAEKSYASGFKEEGISKEQYIEKAVEDILEQCTCQLVLCEKGYRFQFYPGGQNATTQYLNDVIISQEKKLSWIDVCLCIDSKTSMADTHNESWR